MDKIKTVGEYISSFPNSIKIKLKQIRQIVREESPEAVELISYQMPAFKLNKRILIYYAAWKDHVAIYPYPNSVVKFKKELSKYKTSKSTVQFTLDKPLPIKLIHNIIKFRIEDLKKK